MLKLVVKEKKAGPVIGYHPWVFSQTLAALPDGIKPGEPVHLLREKGGFLAAGYFSSYAQIAVRIWGYDEKETVDDKFFLRRLEKAYGLRKRFVEREGTNAYRLINGENDLLPGLIVDKYADYLVLQFHTRGIEVWKDQIVAALEKIIAPKGIFERSDVAQRRFDNLAPSDGLLAGTVPELITIKENGLQFLVDVKEGQKTGFFLDQRDKRKAILRYSRNASVLNCFSYTGGFTVYALAGGADKTTSVDTSGKALELARENIKLNGFDLGKCTFINGDAKLYLKTAKERFYVIILDPPAFIKDRRKKPEGIAGYKGINESAMYRMADGGTLVSCSCSAHLSAEEFRFLLSEACGKARKRLVLVGTYSHGIDHPQLTPFTEGSYLKCFFLQS